MKYAIRNGNSTYCGIKADVIAQELERIRAKNKGYLRTQDVVAEATNAKNPLHTMFKWNNSEAAHAYRLQQARQLIRIIHIENDGPAYYNLPMTVEIENGDDEIERVYQSAHVLINRPDELQAALEYLRSKLLAASRAYEDAKGLIRDAASQKQIKTVGLHLGKAKLAAERIRGDKGLRV